jgi:hypothetical protein
METREEILKGTNGINCAEDLYAYAQRKSLDGRAYTVSSIFEVGIIESYNRPSDIPAHMISQTGEYYYYKGEKKRFSEAKLIQYQNQGLTRD